MTFRVVVADRVAQPGLALLSADPDIEVIEMAGKGRGALEAALADAHALLVRSETKVTADLMRRSPQLRVIARAGTGVDTIDVQAATRLGIAVLNTPGANTVSAAEHTIALLLALLRHIPDAVRSMRRGEWDRKRFEGAELRGKTMGVIGLGRIGSQVAALAKAFAMRVIGHDPFVPRERAEAQRVELVPLERLLAEADVISLHLALTDQTRHLLNAERFGLIKRGAVLVNAARGELVDEHALIATLREGRLAGAALDVFAVEPLPPDHPLRACERVILTPHLAASTAEAQERVAAEICAILRDALITGDISGAINVPGVPREALTRLAPVLELARRLGRLAVGLGGHALTRVDVGYGGRDEAAPRPVQLAALEGVLGAIGVGPVSIVNAQVLGEERGLRLSRRVGPASAGFETTIGVRVEGAAGSVEVIGALTGRGRGRVIRLDGYSVDVVPEGWLVVLQNRDVPGVIGGVGTVLGRAGINIGTYHQARREEREQGHGEGGRRKREGKGEGEALAVIAVDQPLTEPVLDELRALPDVIDVRLASLERG